MDDDKITKDRYYFQKKLKKFVEKYREKGIGIKSIEIEWEDIN